jgi:hypothetical protein
MVPDPGVTPDPSTSQPSGSPSPSPSPGSAAAPSGSPSPSPAPSGFTYQEDRSRWIPPDRLTAAERATNLAAQRATQLEAALQAERARVQALAGVSPKDPDAEEAERIKAGFFQLFPQAKELLQIDPAQLRRILASGESAEHVTRHHWDAHRDSTLTELKTRVAQAMHSDSLSESASRKVVAAFKASVPDPDPDPYGRPTNPEYVRWAQRYEAKDPTLLDEFVTEFVSDFITPAQRAGLMRPRVAVPSGGASRGVVTNPEKRPDYSKMNSVTEMLEAAEAQVDQHYG